MFSVLVIRIRRLRLPTLFPYTTLFRSASELGQNQIRHARFGSLGVRDIERGGIRGIEIVAADRGEGIDDVARLVATEARSKDRKSTRLNCRHPSSAYVVLCLMILMLIT